MKHEMRRFPMPTTLDKIKVGEPFSISKEGGEGWTCIQLEVDSLILGGSAIPGEEFPAFYDVRTLGGQVLKIDADRFVLSPSTYDVDIDFGVPTSAHHGALAINESGRAFIRVKPGQIRREGFVAVDDGSYHPEAAALGQVVYYASWEISVPLASRLWTVYSRRLRERDAP